MTIRLSGIKACVFDAYGTLFDYASAAARCRDVLGDKLDPLNALWREKQLQYTWLRALQGRHADFWQVTGDALDFALETLGLGDAGLRTRLMDLVPDPRPLSRGPGDAATAEGGRCADCDPVERHAGHARCCGQKCRGRRPS